METPPSQTCQTPARVKSLSATPQSKHSKHLLTPCRQVGLRRCLKITSPVNSDTNIKICVTPKSASIQETHSTNDNISKVGLLDEKCSTPASKKLTPRSASIQETNSTGSNDNTADDTSKVLDEKFSKPVSKRLKLEMNEHIKENFGTEDFNTQLSSHAVYSEHIQSGSVEVNVKYDTDTTISDYSEDALHSLRQRVKDKAEKVRHLKMSQLYKKKHDVAELTALTARWKKGCQAALQRLLEASATQGYELTMSQLLAQLGIPPDLVGYNHEAEDFEEE